MEKVAYHPAKIRRLKEKRMKQDRKKYLEILRSVGMSKKYQEAEPLLYFLYMIYIQMNRSRIGDKRIRKLFSDQYKKRFREMYEDIDDFITDSDMNADAFKKVYLKFKNAPEYDEDLRKVLKVVANEIESSDELPSNTTPTELKVLKSFARYFKAKSDSAKETQEKNILRYAVYLSSKGLRRFVRAIETDVTQPFELLAPVMEQRDALAMELFNTKHPTVKRLKVLAKNSKKKYQEFDKAERTATAVLRDALAAIFVAKGWEVASLEDVVEELAKKGVDNPFVNVMDFKGQIDPFLNCYTHKADGSRELDKNLTSGSDVIMNKSWNEAEPEKKQGWYCKFIPKSGKLTREERFNIVEKKRAKEEGRTPKLKKVPFSHVYTLDYLESLGKAKFDKVRRIPEIIGDIRAVYRADLESKDRRKRALACIVALLDMGALRPGSEESLQDVDEPTYGLTTLLNKHVEIGSPTDMTITFVGKKKEINSVQVGSKTVIAAVSSFLNPDEPDERLWKVKGDVIKDEDLREYLAGIGSFSITPKDFRNFTATTIVQGELNDKMDEWEEANYVPSFKEAKDVWLDALKAAAIRLGHKDAKIDHILNNYCDPSVSRDWFDKLSMPEPAALKLVKA